MFRFALCRFALLSHAEPRFALVRFASPKFASDRSAEFISVSVRSAPPRLALVRFAPYRVTPDRFALPSIAPDRFASYRYTLVLLQPAQSTPGPAGVWHSPSHRAKNCVYGGSGWADWDNFCPGVSTTFPSPVRAQPRSLLSIGVHAAVVAAGAAS